jgi:hypothetical protein
MYHPGEVIPAMVIHSQITDLWTKSRNQFFREIDVRKIAIDSREVQNSDGPCRQPGAIFLHWLLYQFSACKRIPAAEALVTIFKQSGQLELERAQVRIVTLG